MISMKCPGCGGQSTYGDDRAGQVVTCLCGEPFRIPRPEKVKPVDEEKKVSRKPDLVIPTKAEQAAQAEALADFKHDAYGTWCPHCGNRCSVKSARGVAVVVALTVLFAVLAGLSSSPLLAIIPIGIGLVLGAFLPRDWKCYQCMHVWRA